MENFIQDLFYKYYEYQNKNILHRRFKHSELVVELNKISSDFQKKIIGYSFENREIYSLQFGNGKTTILVWSQMHGNEPTATLAILDILNFLNSNDNFNNIRKTISENCKIVFIPMLNPDGAEKYIRRNAQSIDLNRDAQNLSAPESQILKNCRDELNVDFGFNLHDQELYYSAGKPKYTSSIAFLAPSYNFEKEINEVRKNSMKIIAELNATLQKIVPLQIAKYSDSYMPNAFGDSFQRWGTSTILIESGYFKNDKERQFIRKLNFISLILSFYSIATQNYKNFTIEEYNSIPFNTKDAIFDYLIKNAIIVRNSKKYKVDIGLSRDKSDRENFTDYQTEYLIWDIGDLSNFSGHQIIDLNNTEINDDFQKITRFSNADFLISKYF